LVETAARLLPRGAGIAAQVYARAFATGRLEPEAFGLSAGGVAGWKDRFRIGLLEVLEVVEEEGEFGPTAKAVLGCADGSRVECVRIPMPPRADGSSRETICVSSQVGCRMGCAFCETGRAGLSRNLDAAEIVAQVVTTRVRLGWKPGNVVFMGMGEPLDNLDNVIPALSVLTDGRGLAYSWERLTLCTSGDAERIGALRELGHPRLNLSLSLNAADDATRSAIMPANRRSGLEALAAALLAYPRRRNFVIVLNWCLLPGINDTREDAVRAAAFARRLGRAIVNLIPYNPGSSPIARSPTEEELASFAAWLGEEGCPVRRRAAKGLHIMAACGQLGGRRTGLG
jgi:23S rRNA (adenine2503-C2)-methyltransferase